MNMGLLGGNDGPVHLENADIDCEPHNDYVSKKTVKKIDDVIEPGEKVYMLAKEGGESVSIMKPGSGTEQKTGTSGHIRTAATDKRIVVKVPQILGNDEISIPYESISTIDLKTGMIQTKMSVQTDSSSYEIGIGSHDKAECREFVSFIRNKVKNNNSANNHTQNNTDSLDKIKQLKEMVDDGIISQEEFEQKKQELLGDL